MKNQRRLIQFAFASVLCLFALSVPTHDADAARKIRIKRAKSDKVTTRSIKPSPAAHRPYTESWSLWAKGDGGWLAYATMFIARMHPFVGTRVGVQLTLISPTGQRIHRLVEFKKKHLYVGGPGLNIRVGKHHITGTTRKGKVVIDLKDVACWLSYKSTLPGYRLFGGTIRVGSRKFRGLPFAPRASIKGYLRWKDKRFRIQGTGYLDRSWQNSPHKIARSWYNARAFGKDYTVLLTSMVPARGWGSTRLAGLSVAYKGKWLFHRKAQQLKMRVFTARSDADSGYRVPRNITLQSPSGDGQQLQLKMTHKRQIHRLDVLSHVPKVLRFFVQKLISKPYLYRSQATMHLQFQHAGQKHEIKLPTLAEAVFLNP